MKWGCGSIGLAVVLASLTVWQVVVRTPTHAYRLTVEMTTPEGSRRASVVRHVFAPCPTFLDEWYGKYPPNSLQGEAVFVDVGSGRNLVALLASGPMGDGVDQPNYLAYYAMEEAGFINKNLPLLAPRLRQCDFTLQNGATALSPRLLPTLVSFADLNDPASARVVEPADVGFVFGPGSRLERITLEMIPTGIWPLNLVGFWGTPVTRGIKSKIPFLTTHREQLRNMMRDMPPRYQAGFSQFIRD